MTKSKTLLFLGILLAGLLAFTPACSDDGEENLFDNANADRDAVPEEDTSESDGNRRRSFYGHPFLLKRSRMLQRQACHDEEHVCMEVECPNGSDETCEALYSYGNSNKNPASYKFACGEDKLCYPKPCKPMQNATKPV